MLPLSGMGCAQATVAVPAASMPALTVAAAGKLDAAPAGDELRAAERGSGRPHRGDHARAHGVAAPPHGTRQGPGDDGVAARRDGGHDPREAGLGARDVHGRAEAAAGLGQRRADRSPEAPGPRGARHDRMAARVGGHRGTLVEDAEAGGGRDRDAVRRHAEQVVGRHPALERAEHAHEAGRGRGPKAGGDRSPRALADDDVPGRLGGDGREQRERQDERHADAHVAQPTLRRVRALAGDRPGISGGPGARAPGCHRRSRRAISAPAIA